MSRDDRIVIFKIINPKRYIRSEPRYLYVIRRVQGPVFVENNVLADSPFEISERTAFDLAHKLDCEWGGTEFGITVCGICNVYIGGVREVGEDAPGFEFQSLNLSLYPLNEDLYAHRVRICTSRNPRLQILTDAFARKGLAVREDSGLCASFIKYGTFPASGVDANCANKMIRTVEEIAEVFEILDFFYSRTRYAELKKTLVHGGPHAMQDDAFAKVVALLQWIDEGNNVAELPHCIVDTILAWSLMRDTPINCIQECIAKCKLGAYFTHAGEMLPRVHERISRKYRV